MRATFARVSAASEEVAGGRRPDLAKGPRRLLLALIVAWAAGVRAPLLPGPFGFGWQHLGALYCDVARNFLRYGPSATRFAQVTNPDVAPREQWKLFMHHPPGMGFMTAGVAHWIGEGPLAIRLPCFLFSLLQVLVTYALVSQALSFRAGLAAAFAAAVLPAGVCFATIGSDLGPPALSLALLALWLDQRARERDPARPGAGLPLLALAASLLFDWPALLVAAFIALRDAVARRRRRALLFAALLPAALGLQFAHIAWATGSFGGGRGGSLVDAFLQHGAVGAASLLAHYPADAIAARAAGHLLFLFTPVGLALAAFGGLAALPGVLVRRDSAIRFSARAGATLAALAMLAVGYTLPFASAVLVHRFWLIVALPLVAFLIGAAVHGTGATRPVLVAWLTAAALLGVLASRFTVAAELAERTPYYEEVGTLLREHVPSGTLVLTTERFSECLDFYAQRELRGDIDDGNLATFVAGGGGAAIPPRTAFALVDPPIDRKDARCGRLREWLESHFPVEVLPLPRSGASLHLFDLSHRLPAKPGP